MNPLDRGWELLDEGQVDKAKEVAERVLGEDPEDPDAHLLAAVCARHAEKFEESLNHLSLISKADPDWAVPPLWSAEILSDDLGRPEDALVQASKALDLADEEEEFLDAVVLKAGLELDLGKRAFAKKTLANLPPVDNVKLPPDLECDIAHLLLEAGQEKEARARFALALRDETVAAHAYYGLGLCAEAREDDGEKRLAWCKVLELDTEAPLDGPRISEAEMAAIAEAALGELPHRARDLLQNVPILISELPAREEVEKGLDPRSLGAFLGTSYSAAETLGQGPHLTQILLFKKNLERVAIDGEDLRDQIRITLLHETGHFFGLDEVALEKLGLG